VNDLAPLPAETAYRFPLTGQDVRIADIDGEPWFTAADLAAILELGNVHSSLALLDDDERRIHTMETPGGPQALTVVSEPGMYSLILRSRKPQARAFRRWITHEVLPAIRRTGTYRSAPAHVPPIDSPEDVLRLAAAFHDAAQRLVGAERRAADLELGAEAWSALADAAGDYSLRDAAFILTRDPGISTGQNRLMRFLRAEGLVDRKGVPYARYAHYLVERPISYTHPHSGEPVLKSQIRVTINGLAYLRKRLGGATGGSTEAA